MRKFKENKGITLVALIITIIILLILAVVSISAVTGDGIIAKAKQARTEYEQAQAEEQTTIDSYLAKIDDATSVFGNITSLDYGKSIEYNDPAGVNDWKVFYKDDKYLYIITSDYLENSKLPNKSDDFQEGLNMSTKDDYLYSAYWATTDNFTATGASNITAEVAKKYGLSWFNDNSTSTNSNARATADLLNTTAWTAKFGDSSKGIEAIGSPTLEMWVASWNAKGEKLGRDKYVELKTEKNLTGYFVGPTSTSSLSDIVGNQGSDGGYYYNIGTSTEGYADELYFPHTSAYENCNGYWLASPSASDSERVILVYWNGSVSGSNYNGNDRSVRPLVSLPSDVITTDSEGNLKVKQ